ncbi:MAG: hypothetical protein HYX92_15170 [Chloroflexi bacterium]|nr:hypothetical protein [Chloroflexota bacterium]
MTNIERLMQGSVDLHVHFAPDAARMGRSVDALQAGRDARDAGMRAILLVSHEYPTPAVAYVVNQVVDGVSIFGGLCLELTVGGLNKAAVRVAGMMGAKLVSLPVGNSANDRRLKGLAGGLSIVDGAGVLVGEMRDILNLVKEYDMIMHTGHVSAEEVFAVLEGCKSAGVTKVLVGHPLLKNMGAALSHDQMRQLADAGAYIELSFGYTMPGSYRSDPMEIVDAVKKVGAEGIVLTTDMGQDFNPRPADGMRVMIVTLLNLGLTEAELEIMIKRNPAHLLGLS